jgi:putative restriction endonuclease
MKPKSSGAPSIGHLRWVGCKLFAPPTFASSSTQTASKASNKSVSVPRQVAMPRKNWTRDELILAFNLYCRTPFGKIHNRNPEIIALANAIGRTPSSVSWKLANFARLDPVLAKRGIAGAGHGSNMEKEIWQEFESDWERLAFESEMLRKNYADPISLDPSEEFPEGKTRQAMVRLRVNQNFFRAAVLAAYNCKCCVTGVDVSELLCASHIVPWSVDIGNRTNPRNGLCLNAFHDRAFDRGLITVTSQFRVQIASSLKLSSPEWKRDWLLKFEGSELKLPARFQPDPKFLQYHNENVFRG